MKRPRLMNGILTAVHLLLSGVAVAWIAVSGWTPDEPPEWLVYPLLTLPLSQACLLGLWVALGGNRTPWRVLFAVVGLAAFAWCVAGTFLGSLAVVRSAGYRLSWQWRFGRLANISEPPDTAPVQGDGK